MALKGIDNVGIVVDDLDAAIAFFEELGLEVEGRTTVEGDWVDRVVGLQGTRSDIAMMHTPDGHGRLELARYQHPPAVGPDPRSEPANTRGMGRIMFNVDNIDDVVERAGARWRARRRDRSVRGRLPAVLSARAGGDHRRSRAGAQLTLR
jgi:catechol 2,3-dioxygenase-like lactoylglutathione lyase family enzyme